MIPHRHVIAAAAAFGALCLLGGSALHLIAGPTRSALSIAAAFLWADEEANVWSWFSGFLLSTLALGLFLLAAVAVGRTRRAYTILGIVALGMSADEIASLHEALRFFSVRSVALLDNWLVVGVPLAIASGLLILSIAKAIDPSLRKQLIVAGVVYLAGAVGFETIGNVLMREFGVGYYDPIYVLEVILEEGLEAAGVLVALHAVLSALRSLRFTVAVEHAGVEQTS